MIYKHTNTVAQATDGAIQKTIHPGPVPWCWAKCTAIWA